MSRSNNLWAVSGRHIPSSKLIILTLTYHISITNFGWVWRNIPFLGSSYIGKIYIPYVELWPSLLLSVVKLLIFWVGNDVKFLNEKSTILLQKGIIHSKELQSAWFFFKKDVKTVNDHIWGSHPFFINYFN